MNDINITLSEVKAVIESLPDNENLFELQQLMQKLEKEITTQSQFIEGVSNYLTNSGQLEKAKDSTIEYVQHNLYLKSQEEKKHLESRGIKSPYAHVYPYDLEWLFDDVKFHFELLKEA